MKKVEIKGLKPNDRIRISSKNKDIDFAKECTKVKVYFDDSIVPEINGFIELLIVDSSQKHHYSVDIESKGNKAVVELKSVTDYNIEDVTVSIVS